MSTPGRKPLRRAIGDALPHVVVVETEVVWRESRHGIVPSLDGDIDRHRVHVRAKYRRRLGLTPEQDAPGAAQTGDRHHATHQWMAFRTSAISTGHRT